MITCKTGRLLDVAQEHLAFLVTAFLITNSLTLLLSPFSVPARLNLALCFYNIGRGLGDIDVWLDQIGLIQRNGRDCLIVEDRRVWL